jgi:hypothetical protein
LRRINVPAFGTAILKVQSKEDVMRGRMSRRAERQARLMGGMMERVGVDPERAPQRGWAFAAASRRCLWCAAVDVCAAWQKETGGSDAPAFCPNAAFFTELASAGRLSERRA